MMRIWHYLPGSICVTPCVTSHQWPRRSPPLVVVAAVVVVDAKSCCCLIRGSSGQSEARYSVYWPMRGSGSVTWAVTRPSMPLTSHAESGQDPTWREDSPGVSILHNHTKKMVSIKSIQIQKEKQVTANRKQKTKPHSQNCRNTTHTFFTVW